MSKLGYGLIWIDWVVLSLLLLMNFFKFSTEVAVLNRNSKLLHDYKNKNKKAEFFSKIT